jgi:hypothetical protein
MVVRNFLEGRIGTEMDIQVDGAIISGRIIRLEGNVLVVEKDDTVCYINIDRIIALWDSKEKKGSLPGFRQGA